MTQNIDEEEVRQLEAEVAGCLIDLTANLMRVTRGAGSPHWIYNQAYALLEAMQAHRTANNNIGLPSGFYKNALSFKSEFGEASEADSIIESVANGSLQFVASKMLEQIPQRAAGEREMMDGFRRWAKRSSQGHSDRR